MLTVKSVFDDVQFNLGKENGYISITDYNRLSRRAENRLQEWITGDIRGNVPPEPYNTQKNKDFLDPFITSYKSVVDGNSQITRPTNYHSFENLHSLSLKETGCETNEGCEEEETEQGIVIKRPIELLNGDEFNIRATTYIDELKPSEIRPIAKQMGRRFEFLPTGLLGVVLEYIRYPQYAVAVEMIDDEFNEPVINEAASTNYEWDENARELLVWFITDLVSNHLREQALKQFNSATGKTVNP